MVRKTKAEAQQTRALLLDAAERLFSERGVAQTTLNDIATAAGVTRGAVYWHFQNKADFIHALWDQAVLPLEASFEELLQTLPDDPLGRVRAKAVTVLKQVVHDEHCRNMMSIILHKCEYVEQAGGWRDAYLTKRGECLAEFAEDFRQAVALGQLPAHLDPHFAAIGLFAVVDGLCFHWLLNPALFSMEEKAPLYIDSHLAGLATQS
ncbi:MAG: TetR family transcriptional regulator [Methylobacillus sp.]|jgi:TetR/AcrR family acrAB operon transcriptional repressor|nr:TetR family transcriptional regulator [Methylobacillus sp.]